MFIFLKFEQLKHLIQLPPNRGMRAVFQGLRHMSYPSQQKLKKQTRRVKVTTHHFPSLPGNIRHARQLSNLSVSPLPQSLPSVAAP